MNNLQNINVQFCFTLNSAEWECSLGSLWAPSVDTSGGHSGTSAVQHSSYFESGAIRNPDCIWKISWNSCFTLAIPGIHPGIFVFSVLITIATQSDEIVGVFESCICSNCIALSTKFLCFHCWIYFFFPLGIILKQFWKWQHVFVLQISLAVLIFM